LKDLNTLNSLLDGNPFINQQLTDLNVSLIDGECETN
jgi:hypothetical protein